MLWLLPLLLFAYPEVRTKFKSFCSTLFSLLFIKVTVSSASNMASKDTMLTLYNYTSSKTVKWLSRGFMTKTDELNDIGGGFHTCVDEFIYFVKLEVKGPYPRFSRTYTDYNNKEFNLIERKPKSEIELTYYIPIWSKNKFFNQVESVSDVDTNCMYKFLGDDEWSLTPKKIHPFVVNYNRDEYEDLKELVVDRSKQLSDSDKVVTLHTKLNFDQVVKNLAVDLNMDLFSIDVLNGLSMSGWTTYDWVCRRAKLNINRPIIISINFRDAEDDPRCVYENVHTTTRVINALEEGLRGCDYTFVIDGDRVKEPYAYKRTFKSISNNKLRYFETPILLRKAKFGKKIYLNEDTENANLQPING